VKPQTTDMKTIMTSKKTPHQRSSSIFWYQERIFRHSPKDMTLVENQCWVVQHWYSSSVGICVPSPPISSPQVIGHRNVEKMLKGSTSYNDSLTLHKSINSKNCKVLSEIHPQFTTPYNSLQQSVEGNIKRKAQ
jgi:hypothetical protein